MRMNNDRKPDSSVGPKGGEEKMTCAGAYRYGWVHTINCTERGPGKDPSPELGTGLLSGLECHAEVGVHDGDGDDAGKAPR